MVDPRYSESCFSGTMFKYLIPKYKNNKEQVKITQSTSDNYMNKY